MEKGRSLESSPSRDSLKDRTEYTKEVPAYSRIFIICEKTVTEEQIIEHFKQFGNVEYCKYLRDKLSSEPKGLCYIKYDLASSALLAIEESNALQLDSSSPIKVVIAEPKGSSKPKFNSKEPEDQPPCSRLFVVCSKDLPEADIIEHFKGFSPNTFEYCKVMTEKNPGEKGASSSSSSAPPPPPGSSKGIAYVKYSSASQAALALEHTNRLATIKGMKIKVLIADPKSSKIQSVESAKHMPYSSAQPPSSYDSNFGQYPLYYSLPRQRLFVVCHKSITHDQLSRFFSRFPGMEYCDLKLNKNTGDSKGFAYINYSTPQAAAMARDQLDGFEFPTGSIMKVLFAEPLGVKGAPADPMSRENLALSGGYAPPPNNNFGGGPSSPPQGRTHSEASPLDSRNYDRYFPEGSRLFVVMSKSLPEFCLNEIFSRYTGFEYTRIQKDKNFGYVKFNTPQLAQIAMQSVNGMEIYGSKLKIQVADPPNESRKRQKTEN